MRAIICRIHPLATVTAPNFITLRIIVSESAICTANIAGKFSFRELYGNNLLLFIYDTFNLFHNRGFWSLPPPLPKGRGEVWFLGGVQRTVGGKERLGILRAACVRRPTTRRILQNQRARNISLAQFRDFCRPKRSGTKLGSSRFFI